MIRIAAIRLMRPMLACAAWALSALAAGSQSGNATAPEIFSDRTSARAALGRVSTWGCQFQNISVAAIVASDLDLVVIEHILDGGTQRAATPGDIERLKGKPDGGRRLVFAYLSVGEAEEYRPYFQAAWKETPPPWLSAPNPLWPGAYGVRFWHPDWQALSFAGNHSLLAPILDAGYDGIFLDRVDAYADWQKERASAAADMIDLVERLATLARTRRPGFLIVGQNAEPLLQKSRYRALIDAVSKESLLYGVRGPGIANTTHDIAWSQKGLEAARSAGLQILAIEYLDDAEKVAQARRRLAAFGYVPFIATRLLDRLPGSHLVGESKPRLSEGQSR